MVCHYSCARSVKDAAAAVAAASPGGDTQIAMLDTTQVSSMTQRSILQSWEVPVHN